jgi:hypothetical protein
MREDIDEQENVNEMRPLILRDQVVVPCTTDNVDHGHNTRTTANGSG